METNTDKVPNQVAAKCGDCNRQLLAGERLAYNKENQVICWECHNKRK